MKNTIILLALFLLSACHAKHKENKTNETFAVIRWKQADKNLPDDVSLINYTIFNNNDKFTHAKEKVAAYLASPAKANFSLAEDKSIGIMLGMACSDAIGSAFEFLPFKKEGYNKAGEKISMNKEKWDSYTEINNNFNLKPGQWTDDTSMGLCLADVFLMGNITLDDTQLMWAFVDWWDHGYNNAFAKDPRHSVGLGSNISLSFDNFKTLNLPRSAWGPLPTIAGTKVTSGNGSLMRNGAPAIVAKSREQAQKLAASQSKVTHMGDEASASCELMSFIMFEALHNQSKDSQVVKNSVFSMLDKFHCDTPSVMALARHENNVPGSRNPSELEDWDWTKPDFSYNSKRKTENPGYVGSYCMDALAMALHCVYTTDTFEDAVLKAISHGGDADSVGAIVGQIAGAIYGAKNIPKDWIDAVQQWDRDGEIAARGYLLTKK